ncbi:MAG: DUF4962 domain-containing protein [Acidobacteria bacterium]|nr:DUF4962 domain-containing protein [Acidobacteriota bacterium]
MMLSNSVFAMTAALAAALSMSGADIDRAARPQEWGYRPAPGETVPVNPPALSWVPYQGATAYEVEWSSGADFKRPESAGNLKWTVYTHNRPLAPGQWYWRFRAIAEGKPTGWSKVRSFTIPASAVPFPQPTLAEVKARIAPTHPRAFLRAEDLPRLRAFAAGAGKPSWDALLARAAALAGGDPTPEPAVKANSKDPATNQYWWSNRVQTLKAANEAEILAFVWLLSGDEKWRAPARRYILALAAWDPDGPTNFTVNCEAAKPLVHRLARVYDWGYGALTEDERATVRRMIVRRGQDAWNSGEVRRGAGHLAEPYTSHANRTWHKLAESGTALMGEAPEADAWLEYALAKYWAAYPVWSDDDGGWHEGLSYWAGYMVKTTWWMNLARTSLGLDPFKKPFFAHFADYALYSAPPGSPEMGFGDLSSRPPSPGWAFVHYYIRDVRNPYWAWWAKQWQIRDEPEEPVLGFLWGEMPPVEAKAPTALPASKLFAGIGVAILNSTLTDPGGNVQLRFKSSPMGRQSHGHDPHNSFTLNAYGDALLTNNVYRDIYGSPFHAKWCWETKSQNALLVNGAGQAVHSASPGGRIVAADLRGGVDYVAGEAGAAYEGKLTRYTRHVLHIKPDVVVLLDEAEAPAAASFQWMLHGLSPFQVDAEKQQLRLESAKAGVLVDYLSEQPLKFRQWTGYDPPTDDRYLASIGRQGSIPPQWHVEASSAQPAGGTWTITVLRPYRKESPAQGRVQVERTAAGAKLRIPGITATVELFREGRTIASVQSSSAQYEFARPGR